MLNEGQWTDTTLTPIKSRWTIPLNNLTNIIISMGHPVAFVPSLLKIALNAL
jgi:hypothetical protein